MVARVSDIGKASLVPYAVIKRSREEVVGTSAIQFDPQGDDLDSFESAFFRIQGKFAAFMHYNGDPPDTLSVYVQRDLSPKDADRVLSKLLAEFHISEDAIVWRETALPPLG